MCAFGVFAGFLGNLPIKAHRQFFVHAIEGNGQYRRVENIKIDGNALGTFKAFVCVSGSFRNKNTLVAIRNDGFIIEGKFQPPFQRYDKAACIA